MVLLRKTLDRHPLDGSLRVGLVGTPGSPARSLASGGAVTADASDPVAELDTRGAADSTKVVVSPRRWQRALIAVGSLVLVVAPVLLVLLVGGEVIHVITPTGRIDVFAAFHNRWVVGVLLGLTVLWLLPPHPWVKHVIAPLSREQPAATAGGAEMVAE